MHSWNYDSSEMQDARSIVHIGDGRIDQQWEGLWCESFY
jgi:hypothetical protein